VRQHRRTTTHAAKRLKKIAQGFSPGLGRKQTALKVATEAMFKARRVDYTSRANVGALAGHSH